MKRKTSFIMTAIAASTLISCTKFSVGETVGTSAWMSGLPDEMPLASLSIPGAHDAATASMNTFVVQDFAKTQMLGISDLLNAGVRVFDLRPAFVDGHLLICHDKYHTNTMFVEAMDDITAYLDVNPSEFAILLVRHEKEADDNSPEWGSAMREALSAVPEKRIMRVFDAGMTVSQMRGRMLVLSRNRYDDGPQGAYLTGWYSGTDIERQKDAGIGDGRLWVQDYYDPQGGDDKFAAITGLMGDFASCEESEVWCINHASGYLKGIFGTPDYGTNAANVNGRTADFIDGLSGPAGIVMMDFAGISSYKGKTVNGDKLLLSVIGHNAARHN